MTVKPIFTDRVTHVPAEWANLLSTLAYDVFEQAVTKNTVRSALGIGTLGIQNALQVQIAGGTIDGTTIGLAEPTSAKFTRAWVATIPTEDNEVVNKHYVDTRDLIGVLALSQLDTRVVLLSARVTDIENTPGPSLGTMAVQNANAVAVTGGVINGVAVSNSSLNNTSIGNTTPSTAVFTRAWVATIPLDASEATSKSYVDSAVSNVSISLNAAIALKTTQAYVNNAVAPYLLKTGGSLTGALILAADPALNLAAATKQYVDQKVASISGGTSAITSLLQRTSITSCYSVLGVPTGQTAQHTFEWSDFEKPGIVHTNNFVVYADGILQKPSSYSIVVTTTPILTFADGVDASVELDILYYYNLKDPLDVSPVGPVPSLVVSITGIYEEVEVI